MAIDFMDMRLQPGLLQAVIELGYLEPTPIQSAVIPLMLEGRDVIGRAQTGTGKTAAFMLPILQNLQPGIHTPQALVLAPTRELALQVASVSAEYAQHLKARILPVYGGASYAPQLAGLRRGADIVVGTPGRLIDLLERGALDLSALRTIILDEADEMLSMGFLEDIQKILQALPEKRQTALFSATMPDEIRKLASQYMHDPQTISIEPEQPTVASIDQRYILVRQNDKTAALARMIEMEQIHSALIFARTRLGSSDLYADLSARGYPVEVLNGDLSQDARERVVRRFRQNQIQLLIATDVAARGLDIENISHVFNFDLPDDVESYVHRIGRTGRAGRTGIAISFVTPAEKWRLRRIEAFIKQEVRQVPIPTPQQINEQRDAQFLARLQDSFTGNIHPERKLASQLRDEGIDLLDIAAGAIRLARELETRRPIPEISEISERPPRRESSYSSSAAGRKRSSVERPEKPVRPQSRGPRRLEPLNEPGMVRMEMDLGRKHGIHPADVVGNIAFHADIPGKSLGRIFIGEDSTFVDVPENMVERVLERNGRYRIRRQKFGIRRAAG